MHAVGTTATLSATPTTTNNTKDTMSLDRFTTAHRWAHDAYQRNGTINGGNIYAEECTRTIYSYGTHFPIARRTDSVAFPLLFTYRTNSSSTNTHIRAAYGATDHIKKFMCYDPSATPRSIYRKEMEYEMVERMEKWASACLHVTQMEAGIAKRRGKGKPDSDHLNGRLAAYESRRDEVVVGIQDRSEELERFRKEFKITIKELGVKEAAFRRKFKAGTWHGLTAKLAAIEKRARAKAETARLKRQEELLAKEEEKLVKWLAGESVYLQYQSGAAKLRVKDDMVETSQGAEVPVSDAWRLWGIVSTCRKHSREYKPSVGYLLGHYRLTSISAIGDAVIGCHLISYSEMELIAPDVKAALPATV